MREYDFYIVPTPIGNLGDITQRAIDILKSVDLIACEDSRVTQKLLNHFDIKTKCMSYHKFNENERIELFLNMLQGNKISCHPEFISGSSTDTTCARPNGGRFRVKPGMTKGDRPLKIALVSDAGTPLFCDPGSILVRELRKNNIKITALPGANAAATFLSQVAREGEDFWFAGFLPKGEGQIKNILEKYKRTDIVFYDSPNRILNTLKIVEQNRPKARVAVGRELSKVFEEVVEDEVGKVIDYFENNILKGEIVALIFRNSAADTDFSLIEDKIAALKSKGFGTKDISVIISELYGVSKNELKTHLYT